MSRVGKLPIPLPAGVQVNPEVDRVSVKGPKGTLSIAIEPGFEVAIDNGQVTINRPTEQKRHRALHGLYRALINNLITGVSTGYQLQLEMVGVGYRAEAKGRVVEFALGYSHQIIFVAPPEISITTTAEKGKNPTITLQGIDKQLLGQVAAKIKSLREPEPYKGKGIRFVGEVIRRKVGKAAGKGKK